MTEYVNCPDKKNLLVKSNIGSNATLNKANQVFITGGYMDVSEKIDGPIEILVELIRCDLDNKNCEKFLNLRVIFPLHFKQFFKNVF